MKMWDTSRWNVRAAMVYALGSWTLVGGLVYNYYYGKLAEGIEKLQNRDQNEDQESNTRKEVIVTPHSRSVVTYREDNFVFTTWLLGLLHSVTGGPRDK